MDRSFGADQRAHEMGHVGTTGTKGFWRSIAERCWIGGFTKRGGRICAAGWWIFKLAPCGHTVARKGFARSRWDRIACERCRRHEGPPG